MADEPKIDFRKRLLSDIWLLLAAAVIAVGAYVLLEVTTHG